jgi:uncharacterized membrane protein YjgN (DUF898 family)
MSHVLDPAAEVLGPDRLTIGGDGGNLLAIHLLGLLLTMVTLGI